MILFLLDTVGFIKSIPLAFFLFLLIWGFAEGLVIYFFRIRRFLSAIWQAVLVNFVSLVACVLTLYLSEQEQWGDYTTQDLEASNEVAWIALFLLSALLEGALLKAMNKKTPWRKICMVSLVMNFATFLVLYLYVDYSQ